MRIGVSTAAYYGRMETEEAAAYLTTLGVSCCEAFLQTMSEYGPAFAQTLKQHLGELEVISAHSKTLHFEGDFLSQSPRQREDGFSMMETFLTTAQTLGAHIYVFHGPPRLRGDSPPLARWQPHVQEAIMRSAAHGVTLAWETVSWCWLNSLGRIADFKALWPDLRFVLDVKQTIELGLDVIETVNAMGERLCHVHVLDYDADGRHVLPGKGRTDFRALARALRVNGYAGDIILEPYATQTENRQDVLDAIAFLRDTFDAD